MTPNRTHLAEQVLELILDECRYWQHKDEARRGNFAILYAAARELVDKAQSAPEPVSREAVQVVGVRISTDGFGSYIADSAMGIGGPAPGEVRESLMTVNQHNRMMAATPSPDAELVELVRSKFPRIDPCQPVPLDEKAHCCEYTIYVERERLHRIIDAKLASLK
jgi:hypothetical protein